MRILPDNPSVDFLKREAKDLLLALRESTPDATLATAQRVLAEQYGYRTWAELKTDVERRRASTPVGDHELARDLADAFALGNLTGDLLPISYGYMGRTWCLQTERGRFLAWPVYPWVKGPQAELANQLRERAIAAGVQAPRAMRARDGELVRSFANDHWLVLEWLDFGPAPMPPVRAGVARKVGGLMAAIHGLDIATDVPVTPYLTHKRSDEEWQALVDRATAAKKPWRDELVRVLPRIAELRAAASAAPASPLILTHCNLLPEAVRSTANDDLAVVHWDFAGSLTREWELGSMLMQWAFRPALNAGAARALVEGYAERAGAFPALDVPSFSVAICGWLNWAHATICTAIDPEHADQADVAERETREILANPMTVGDVERLLAALQPATR